MTIKVNRESILVSLTVIIILVGLFYYGNLSLVQPLKEEATELTETVKVQKSLVEKYPPSEGLLSKYESKYSEAKLFLPVDVKANKALVTLEGLTNTANVSIVSVSRVESEEPIEVASEGFAKDTYTTELTADSPVNFRQLINLLMEEERVWNIPSFSYSKSGEGNYTANLDFELYYRIKNKK